MHPRTHTFVTLISSLAIAATTACAIDTVGDGADPGAFVSGPVDPRITSPVRHKYDDAPRTPDADDPAIYRPRSTKQRPLVIATLKDAGLEVYDLAGNVVQAISPQYRPAIAAADPLTIGRQPDAGTGPCPGSESGEVFGRFNNVDIVYGFELGSREIDIAVVSDRGCDRLWIFEINPARSGGPLFDITAADAPRVFPEKRTSPSPVQSPGATAEVDANPIDDQETAYGLDAFGDEDDVRVVVTQELRNTLGIYELFGTSDGRVSYRRQALLHFPSVFEIPNPDGAGSIAWTPCREDPEEDLQFEGLVVDEDHDVLYATQEVVGVWAIDLDDDLEGEIVVSADRLVERVVAFGAPFYALPDEDEGEFECTDEAPVEGLPPGSIVGPGNPAVGGENLEADVEGVTIYYADGDEAAYLIVSSQGSSSYHVYDLDDDDDPLAERHLGDFEIEGVGSTDGLEVSNANLGGAFGKGLLVVQNGEAPEPASTDPVNGFEYDGSTQFVYVRWTDVARRFDPPLAVEP